MSDSQAYEEVTVAAHGVTVTKRFEEDEFPVPAIAFEFASDRDETVRVVLEDTVPDSVEVEDLGFHPEYGSEYWTIDDSEITFEREIDANAEYTTVYGIRATGTDEVEKFLTRPELTEVDPPLPEEEQEAPAAGDGGEDVIPESDDDVVRDVISGESDEVPGLDEESDEEIETLDLKDPNQEGGGAQTDSETTESSDDADETESSQSGGSVSVSGDSLVTALATELRQNEVSAEDVKLLRQAFEIAGQEGGSIQARVERVQSDIADLRAYTDALEEFLDENGTATQLIDDFQDDVESLEETVNGMQGTIEENSEEMTAVSDEVGSLGDDVAELNEEVTSVRDEVDDVSEEVDEVSAEMQDFDGSIDELESSLEDVQASVAELEGKVTEGDVAERIEELEEQLDDLQTWQEQIKETFGG
jgi:methyl-accepting chemotaxis protein